MTASEAHQSAEAAIKAKYAEFAQILADGGDALTLAEAMYWPEVVVTGEGIDKVYHHLSEMVEIAEDFGELLGRNASWTLAEPLLVSGDLASAYTQLRCTYDDKPPYTLRILYVWHRRGGQWKVAHEMLCAGEMA